MEWTTKQRRVIELRDCNILVSAAAGSGKTAVLVERILSRIMDEKNPVDVDQFLIVTFTRAAAAQMRERLMKALEKALEEEPDNERLQRQIMLLPMAQISTIDSFCGYVIQNYFHCTGVDPSYRVGSENELGLLRSDVMAEMLEEWYERGDEDFLRIAGMSRFLKSDAGIEKMTLKLYEKAMSEAFPEKFFQRMRKFLEIDTVEELRGSEFYRRSSAYVRAAVQGICESCSYLLDVCRSPRGPEAYVTAIQDDYNQLEAVSRETEYDEIGRKLSLVSFGGLSRKRQPDAEEEKKELVKKGRKAIKDMVKELCGDYFSLAAREQLEQLRQMRQIILPYLDLAEDFRERYAARKRARSLIDFADLEQMALEILVYESEDGEICPTEAAKELAEQFAEIMIDEYQDSNLAQDILLGSVSSGNNLFMVGDIKQSIYRFRMARPDLFLGKLDSYSTEGGENVLVNLSRNFRSCQVIVDGTNAVFEKIMHRDLGGVEYDEDAKLRLGASYPETHHNHASDIDLYLLEEGQEEAEGKWIASLIETYTGGENPLYVYDGEKAYRRARYGDIVILVRSTRNSGTEIYDALASEGIPVYMESTTGFFDTKEISLLVNLFRIIDNPRQDIPLAAVMKSVIFDFSDDELAVIRGGEKKVDFYTAVAGYEGDAQIEEKIQGFLSMLERFRDKMSYVSVADMLREIYRETRVDYLLCAMKNGQQRKANLELLMELAREFDATSYQGLHQFVRYISGIKKREEDLGEANRQGNSEDVVRIMTIHKSKGLEFPICILAGMGKGITGSRNNGMLEINSDVGIGTQIVDNEKGISKNNIFYKSLCQMNQMEDLGEELRVLYVAMTRAKEKLVFTGCVSPQNISGDTGYLQRIRPASYLDWIMPATEGNPLFHVTWVEQAAVEQREIEKQADYVVDEVMLNNFDTSRVYNVRLRELLDFMEAYETGEEEEIPTKLSVSEIKKKSMEEYAGEGGFTVLDAGELENQPPVPRFARTEEEESQALAGAGYGTVWHQVMAGLDFVPGVSKEDLESDLEKLMEAGKLRREDMKYIRISKLHKFFSSELGKEMCAAWERGCLHREQPFVTWAPACEVVEDTEQKVPVLVQGIIDAYYETEEGIVLMDYKTDRLEKGQEAVLVKRYGRQMELYAGALEQITGKPVARAVFYSFSLDKEIENVL